MSGEVNSKIRVNYEKIARREIKSLGYTIDELDFTYKSPVEVLIHTQSAEIAHGVKNKEAGDQGMMIGLQFREIAELRHLPYVLAISF